MAGELAAGAGGARARCEALRTAGTALKARPIAGIVEALDAACGRWRDPGGPDRRDAEAALARWYGVPGRSIAPVLDAAFESWDADAMREWLDSELGRAEVLDRPVAIGSARRRAFGPELLVALSAHGVPTTPVADLLAALLVKAPAWIKPASGADELTAQFARTIATVDPELALAVETAGWTSGSAEGREVLAAADLVVATGREETVAALRRAVGSTARLVVHGPRLSAALITREALAADPEGVISALAGDTAFAGQMGCLSPVVAWIEAAAAEAAALVEPLHAACVERWPAPSRAEAEPGERARFAEWLSLAGVERAAGTAGRPAGGFDSGWSVQARARAEPPSPPPVPRLLVLAMVEEGIRAAELCAHRRGLMACVGLAAPPNRAARLTSALAQAGVERVAPLGAMQRPPLAWRRDGRATLADLVRWFDWEG